MQAKTEIECEIGDTIRLGDGMEIKILRSTGRAVRIGIAAPASVAIVRAELLAGEHKKSGPEGPD